jgi:hypothetical protein
LRLKGTVGKDLFEISIDALEAHVFAISDAEHFEESIFIFCRLCGLDSVAPWIRDNRNEGRPLAEEISSGERDTILEVYEYDFKLYEYALNRFRDQISRLSFDNELEAYKHVCNDQYKDRLLA